MVLSSKGHCLALCAGLRP